MRILAYLVCILASISIMSCTQGGNESAIPSVQKLGVDQYYQDSPSETSAAKVSHDLGILVEIQNSKDFANEYKYNAVLNLIENNLDAVRSVATNVTKIIIGSVTQAQETDGQFTVLLSMDLNQTDFLHFFKEGFPEEVQQFNFEKQMTAKVGMNVIDGIGLSPDTFASASETMVSACSQVDFAEDPSFRSITLSNQYLVTADGATINLADTADNIASQLKLILAVRNDWNVQMPTIAATSGLRVTYQAGTFTSAELLQALANFKVNAEIFKGTVTKFSSVILGKRWDNDYANGVILVDYSVVGDALKSQLLLSNPAPQALDFQSVIQDITAAFLVKGITLNQVLIDLPRTDAGYSLLKDFETNTISTLPADILARINPHTLHLGSYAQTVSVLIGTQEIFVSLPTSASIMANGLSTSLVQQDYSLQIQSLQSTMQSLSLPVIVATYTTAMSELNVSYLRSLNTWLATGELNPAVIMKEKISEVTVSFPDNSETVTNLTGGILTISFNDFQTANMHRILSTPVPKPSPTP